MGIKDLAEKAATGALGVARDYMVGRAIRQAVDAAEEEERKELPEDDQLFADLEAAIGNAEFADVQAVADRAGFDPEKHTLITISSSDLVRRALYDSGNPDPESILRGMGWPTPSPEVSEMDKRASDERMSLVEPLSNLVHAMTTAVLTPSAVVEDWDDEDLVEEVEFFAHGTLSVIAQLITMGLLEVGLPLHHLGVVNTQEENEDD